MSGIFFFGVLFVLGCAALWLARRLTLRVKNKWLRGAATATIVAALMTLLVIDELIGGYQLRALCRESATLKIDTEKARGRTVKVFFEPSNEELPWTAVTIYHSHMSYRDVVTNDEVASNEWYFAKGGWFIRLIGFGATRDPISIWPSYCFPSISPGELASTYGIALSK